MQQQPLNKPEDLKVIREAMDAGQSPLVASDVPRWEDQVGVSRVVNRRVLEFEVLPTPTKVLGDLPLSDEARDIVAYSRDEIRACLYGQDDRLLVIVGPCSVHDPAAAAQQHTFFGIDHLGRAAVVKTLGNPDCHEVLRGSSSGPNYAKEDVAAALETIRKRSPPNRPPRTVSSSTARTATPARTSTVRPRSCVR